MTNDDTTPTAEKADCNVKFFISL